MKATSSAPTHPPAQRQPAAPIATTWRCSLESSEVPAARQETIRHQFHQVESEDVFLWARLAAATLARLSEALAIVTPLPGHSEHGLDEPVVYGISQVVNQPELIDQIEMVRELLEAVESGRLAPALHTDDLPASGLRVVIGHEHHESFLHPYAAIMSAYGPAQSNRQRGAVVALGPDPHGLCDRYSCSSLSGRVVVRHDRFTGFRL